MVITEHMAITNVADITTYQLFLSILLKSDYQKLPALIKCMVTLQIKYFKITKKEL